MNAQRSAAWRSLILMDPEDAARIEAGYRLAFKPGRGAYLGRVIAFPRCTKRRSVGLARIILSVEPGLCVDHINGDTFDNRRANLRVCTQRENGKNQRSRTGASRFKGVTPRRTKWIAQIECDRSKIHLGMFPDEESAARAYDAAARLHHGAFAALNFPGPGETSARDVSR